MHSRRQAPPPGPELAQSQHPHGGGGAASGGGLPSTSGDSRKDGDAVPGRERSGQRKARWQSVMRPFAEADPDDRVANRMTTPAASSALPGSWPRALSSLALNPPENPVKPVRLTPSLYAGGHGFGKLRPGGSEARTLSTSACPQSPGSALYATSPPPSPQTLRLLPHPVTHPGPWPAGRPRGGRMRGTLHPSLFGVWRSRPYSRQTSPGPGRAPSEVLLSGSFHQAAGSRAQEIKSNSQITERGTQ